MQKPDDFMNWHWWLVWLWQSKATLFIFLLVTFYIDGPDPDQQGFDPGVVVNTTVYIQSI